MLRALSLRSFLIIWLVVWAALVCLLWTYWNSMPKSISWVLTFIEALLVPNVAVVKKYVLKSEG